MSFPARRLRRFRRTAQMRNLFQETNITPTDLVCPIFVQENLSEKVSIDRMPGIQRFPLSDVTDEVESIIQVGIPAIMLFGIPAIKDDVGSAAFAQDGIVQQTASQIRKTFGDDIVIMADVCMCQYASSGHCGIIHTDNKGKKRIDNDTSLEILAKTAITQARAGVDIVSLSAMMDGQVSTIRSALDDAGFTDVLIMSQASKHHSNFYSPFRDAVESGPQFGDRATYQAPYTNFHEAMLESELDVSEGVDILTIKPALAYLDLIVESRRRFDLPIAAYSASGEYAMVKAAAAAGYVNGQKVALEILHSIKRAGADMIVTYFAKDIAGTLVSK